jgi:hypothetical protein
MVRFHRRLGLAVATVLAFTGLAYAAQTAVVGRNTAVAGSVQTRSVGEADWRAAVWRGKVRRQDQIRTAADGQLRIDLNDRSQLTVGANATLTLDSFVLGEERSASGLLVSVTRGLFRYSSSSRGKAKEKVRFQTPGASIGIRGTIIEGAVGAEAIEILGQDIDIAALDKDEDPDGVSVIILREGAIELTAKGRAVRLDQPGQAVVVGRLGPSRPFGLPAGAEQRFEDRIPGGETRGGRFGVSPEDQKAGQPGAGQDGRQGQPGQPGQSGQGNGSPAPPQPKPKPPTGGRPG